MHLLDKGQQPTCADVQSESTAPRPHTHGYRKSQTINCYPSSPICPSELQSAGFSCRITRRVHAVITSPHTLHQKLLMYDGRTSLAVQTSYKFHLCFLFCYGP
eukprot:5756322-Amphidinium_carterae.1